MRLKLKWVLFISALTVGMWMTIIIILPAPSNTSNGGKNLKREHYQSGPGDGEVKGHIVDSAADGQPKKPSDEKEVDIVGFRNAEESEPAVEEKKVPQGVEIENIRGNPPNGQSNEKPQNESLPWELDLLPTFIPKRRHDYMTLWSKAESWVTSNQITPSSAKELGSVLYAMANAPITKADVGFKGTQLKARLMLEGGQLVVFKPKRYPRDHVIYGTPYAGYDRHNGEIAAFHLDRVLDFRRAPLVVGRTLNLKTEILPVASPALNDTFLEKNNNICFYGKCYYCKPEEAACADGFTMEGSVTLWLPPDLKLKKWRHLWSRTYKDGKKAKWETDDQYCVTLMTRVPPEQHPLVLHMTDGAVFDYLIGNADRHMYETFEKDGDRGMLLHMDNAKSFGNPYLDEGTILAPIYQCCRLRRSTWNTLQQFKDGRLSQVMGQVLSHDPIAPVLTIWHLEALDRRLNDIIDTMHNCFTKHGEDVVLMD
ncbi:glycosaminoglycan xylosylkinase [Strongylocentrotus purpuratus]|uniref:FAM20 C-terminal domain-containing protein n=1 Tax=Strongylocentrotus purpuratus TaxID=7668 RepID=A0A7M7HBY1_STRPU|nr:glycosaminoglycan xylosylkinase [Strongylocentrotus purpuratus]